jgi:hypothetical protein
MFGSHGNLNALRCLSLYDVTNNAACVTGTTSGPYILSNAGLAYGPIPTGGITLSHLIAQSSAPPNAGTGVVINILDMTTSTTLTCTIPVGSTQCTDDTHTWSVPAGDYIQVQINPNGAADNQYQVQLKYG